ncbi:hypothetical protein EON65_18215 [archaeon]|nr:MAG: hypothetical protein EON65_18215 [archaeon]
MELRNARLQNQAKLRAQVEAGKLDYREDTAWIRERRWKVAQIPPILQKRPVELTGPANDIGMMINAFNTGAIARKVVPNADAKMPLIKYMPDSEDSSVPTLKAELQGILNLKHALQGTLSFEKTVDGKMKKYSLGSEIAYPIFRVPGIHLNEATMVDRYYRPVPNHLLLTCLYMYHVAPLMKEKGWVPSLYQPKVCVYVYVYANVY